MANEVPLGLYELPRRSGEAHLYRMGHPLAEAVLAQAKGRELTHTEVCFDYAGHEGKVSILEPLAGQSGWLMLSQLSIESLNQTEDYLLFATVTDANEVLDEEIARRLLSLPGRVGQPAAVAGETLASLERLQQQRQEAIQRSISERNARFFEVEIAKLDAWSDDLKVGLEREIKDLDRQIKEARRAATLALTLEEKLAGQKQVRAIESSRNQKRRSLFEAQDQVDKQREQLIAQIEGKLAQRGSLDRLFIVHWNLGCHGNGSHD
jgi:hypothetical protein